MNSRPTIVIGPWVVLIPILAGVLIWLAVLASQGNVTAIVFLAVLAAVFLVCLGVVITLLASWAAAKREQTAFVTNARENLAIIGAVQQVQNQQNAMLLRQAREMQRALPRPADDGQSVDALLMDTSVFDGLGE